ncbi:MAG: transcriptional regulator GcvA [Pseudomonadota bacterium]
MSDRLPPLTALRAFDAAQRHMSFARAAEELNVTPAALSFQIKSLEDHLGLPLFHRLNRRVELTEAGRALAPGTQDGFETLIAAWRAARRLTDNTTIVVTAGPAFTAKWLAPRMYKFAQAHPDIELRFSAALRIMDFERDEIDVAIRYGLGHGAKAGLFSHPVFADFLVPVMVPNLAERFPTPESLVDAPLLWDQSLDFLDPPVDWPAWFRANDLFMQPPPGAKFNQSDHALDAAQSGAGILLGRSVLAQKALSEGRLVAPFPVALTTDADFRFVCPSGLETRPNIRAFLQWIVEEARAHDDLSEGRRFVPAADVPAG